MNQLMTYDTLARRAQTHIGDGTQSYLAHPLYWYCATRHQATPISDEFCEIQANQSNHPLNPSYSIYPHFAAFDSLATSILCLPESLPPPSPMALEYHLVVRQQPKAARMCGLGKPFPSPLVITCQPFQLLHHCFISPTCPAQRLQRSVIHFSICTANCL